MLCNSVTEYLLAYFNYYFIIILFIYFILLLSFFIVLLHSHPGPNVTRATVGSQQEREPGERTGTLPTPAGEGQSRASIRAGPAVAHESGQAIAVCP